MRFDAMARFMSSLVGLTMFTWGMVMTFKFPPMASVSWPVNIFGLCFAGFGGVDLAQASFHFIPPDSLGQAALGYTKARPARNPLASRSVRRTLLTPQVNPGSLYRCGRSA